MLKRNFMALIMAGAAAGTVNGLFGAGGGMVLVPLLTAFSDLTEAEIFPVSVSIILPICLVSIAVTWASSPTDWALALPYLLGSALGGLACGIWGRNIPVKWLHRALGVLILTGGVRYLC